jgi:hypothetical protein
LAWSRCYIDSGKKLDCVTCHNPHRDAETSSDYYEAKCLQCPGSETPIRSAASKAGAGNTFKARTTCPVESRKGCIACHMPKDGKSVPNSEFTDHLISVHRKAGNATRPAHPTRN